MTSWRLGAVLLLSLLAPLPAAAAEVGFSLAQFTGSDGDAIRVGVWYPADAEPSDQEVGLYTQSVAPDAPVAGGGHGLIVVSHGTGGSLEGHYDTALALARAGYVVAAVTHPGDNFRDSSRAVDLPARPRAIRDLVGFMLTDWSGRAALDASKIGVFGFSSGGFTALVLIGGVPDLSTVGPYCESHPATFVCGVVRSHPPPRRISASEWVTDQRIKAAVIAAPALGFAFAHGGLAAVHVPVQLWRAGDDHILPSPDYVEPVRDALPSPPEYHVAEGADHFDFLAPCSEELARVAPDICAEVGGFDRTAFHAAFDAEVVRFFDRALR
jgi:predicted dienelactone hydrolase